MSKRDVELVIRARDDASKNVDSIADSLDALTAAQKKLASSSNATGDQIDALVSDISKLGTAGKAGQAFEKINQSVASANAALAKQESQFNETEQEVASYSAQLDAARKVLASLRAEAERQKSFVGPMQPEVMAKQATALKAVEKAVVELDRAYTKSSGALNSQQTELTQTRNALRQLDGELGKASLSMARMAAIEKQVGDAQAKQVAAVKRQSDARAQQAAVNARVAAGMGALAAAEERIARTADAAAAAQRRAAQQAAETQRINQAATTVRFSTDSVNREAIGQTKLRVAVLELKAAYQQLDGELKRTQASSGLFGSKQDAIRAKMVGLAGLIRTGESSLKAYGSAAGVATNNSSRMGSAAGSSSGGFRTLGSQVKQVANQLGLFNNETRTTLSLTQRIRGQVLSLAASYGGLYGAINAVSGVLDAVRDMEGIEARFRVGFDGDLTKAAQELQFTRDVADNLGLNFRTLAKEYSKLTSATRGTAVEGEKTRSIFVGMAQAARVLRLSDDELAGSFKAITDILSKGTVSAEELKGQLGDRFPGAVNIMAQALGIGTKELLKMMEQGQLTSDTLVYFTNELQKRVGPELATAITGSAAGIERFKNAIFSLQIQFANSGFLDAFTKGLEAAMEELKKPETIEGIKTLGSALGELIRQMVALLPYMDEIVTGLGILGGIIIGGQIVSAIVSLSDAFVVLASGLRVIVPMLAGFAGALGGPVLIAVGAIAAIFATPWLLNWAYDNFPAFKQLSIDWADTLMTLFEAIKEKWAKVAAFFAFAMGKPLEAIGGKVMEIFSGIFEYIAKGLRMVGLDAWASKFESAAKVTFDVASNALKEYNAEVAKIEQQSIEGTLKRKAIFDDMRKDIQAGAQQVDRTLKTDKLPTSTGNAAGLGGPAEMPAYEPPGGKDKVLKETEKLADRVTGKIADLKQRLAELSAQDMDLLPEEQLQLELEAIRSKYEEVFADLTRLGKDQNSEEWKTVEALIRQEQLLAKQKWDKEQITNQTKTLEEAERDRNEAARDGEKVINDLLAQREALEERLALMRASGAEDSEISVIEGKIKSINAQLPQAIDSAIGFWQAVGGPEADAAIAKLETMRLKISDTQKTAILDAKQLNDQIAGGLTNSIMAFAEGLGDAIIGAGSLKDAFASAGDAFRQFVADFLKQIAQAILQAAILKMLTGSVTGGAGGIGGTIVNGIAGLFHDGGVVGQGGAMTVANPAWFNNARRYHTGGVVGLKPNEVPAVLEKGEEVLTRNDPRHVDNGGGGTTMGNIKIVNAIDSGSFISEGLDSVEGEKAFMNKIRANKAAIKTMLG